MQFPARTTAALVLFMTILASCAQVASPTALPVASTAVTVAAAPAGGFAGLMNAQRASAGLPPATADARLTAAALAHAQDLFSRNYFSHTSPEGTSSADRIRAAGYSTCRSAENLAFGQFSETAVLQGWIASPLHLANIMMRGPVQYGLGNAGNKWVMVVAGVC